MRVDQLEPGTTLNFLVDINGTKMTLESSIQEVIPKRRLVLAEPIYREDKIVSFKGSNIIVDVLAIFPDDKPIVFKNAEVTTMRKGDGSLCYNIACINEGKIFNRRTSFRCFVGVSTTLQIGPGQPPVNIIIRDVSNSGFAITCSSDVELNRGQLVHLVLNDYIAESDENYSYQLYGAVVRSQDLENGKRVYGCKLTGKVGGLENYIAKKERMSIKKS